MSAPIKLVPPGGQVEPDGVLEPTGSPRFVFDGSTIYLTAAAISDGAEPSHMPPLDTSDSDVLSATDREKFERLRDEWLDDTAHLSQIQAKVGSKSYHSIFAMGDDALPFIFEELRAGRLFWWFWALEVITQTDPVPQEDRGDVRAMARYWLEWAVSHGY